MKHRNGLGLSRAARLGRLSVALVLVGLMSPAASPWLSAEENRVGLFGSRKDKPQGETALPPIPKYEPQQPSYGPATAGGSNLQQFVPTGPPPKLVQPEAPAPRKVKPQAVAPAPTESAYNPQFGEPTFQPEAQRARPGVPTIATQTGGQLEQFVPNPAETRKFQRQQAAAAAEAQQQALEAQQQQMSRPAAPVETAAERKQREFYEKYPMPKFEDGAARYPGPYNPYGPQTAGGRTLQQFQPSGKVKPVQYDAAPAPSVPQAPSPQELARQAEKERQASAKYYEAKLTMPIPTYEPKPQPGAFYGQGALMTAGGSPLQHYNVPPPAHPKVVTNEPPTPEAPTAAELRAQRRAEKAAAEAAAATARSQNTQTLPIPTYQETQQVPAGTYYGGPTTASGRPLQPYQPGKKR